VRAWLTDAGNVDQTFYAAIAHTPKRTLDRGMGCRTPPTNHGCGWPRPMHSRSWEAARVGRRSHGAPLAERVENGLHFCLERIVEAMPDVHGSLSNRLSLDARLAVGMSRATCQFSSVAVTPQTDWQGPHSFGVGLCLRHFHPRVFLFVLGCFSR